jgi:hypothetical protein
MGSFCNFRSFPQLVFPFGDIIRYPMREGLVFLCRRYICCNLASVQVISVVSISLWTLCAYWHCTILINIYTRYTEVSVSRLVQQVMP